MTQMRRAGRYVLTALALVFCAVVEAQSGSPAALQQKLNAQFKLTTTTADRSDIVTAGDVVVLHMPGFVMFSTNTAVPPTSTYKSGKITQGIGTTMLMANPRTPQRRFVPEEKCWVTRIVVENESVAFELYSDAYNNVRYYGTLKVAFPDKKVFPPVDSFLQTIAEVLTLASQNGQAGGTTPASAPASMPAIAPPPPPADAPPPTIALGQTKDQVTAGFGQPTRIAKLGAKEIYYYKDMKVTFTNGKVSNVE